MIHLQLDVILTFLGVFSVCNAEEIQTTAWKIDAGHSVLNGTGDSEPLNDDQITDKIYPDVRSKRQTDSEDNMEYMFFANQRFLVQMYLNATIRNVLVLSSGNAISCDYDIRDEQVYWSDVSEQIIVATGINNSTDITILVDRNVTIPDGIAWDWITKKVYWTDAEERDIEVLDPTSGDRKILIKNELGSIPRAIVLDPTTRMMYWTDWGTTPMIERASMDGTARSVIINSTLGWPNGLTLDYVSQTLYWVDALLDKIEKSNVDGSMRMLLPTPASAIQHPFGITFFEGYIYWSDWATNSIYTAAVNDTEFGTHVFFANLTFDPMQLHIVDSSRQPIVNNPCQINNGGCSDLCLLSSTSVSGYTCTCSDLYPDNSTCTVVACNASGESDVKIDCEGITPQISVHCSFNEGPLHPCTLPLVLNTNVSPPGNHSVKIVVNNAKVTVSYMINGDFVNEPAVSAQVPPLDVYLINGSPQIYNDSVTAEFQITRPVAGVRCFLRSQYDRRWKDCTSGQVSLPILRAGPHILKIHAYNRKTDVTTVKRGFVVNSDPNYCSLVLVNRGVIVGEDGTSAVIQVRVYGPSIVLSCELDGGLPFTCTTPVVLSGLTIGQHKLKISPLGCSGGSKALTVKFDT